MHISKLYLNNFRNYSEETLNPINGLNIIAGENASGKTNLLEALYLCGIGKSPRTPIDKDIIKWGEDYLYIKLQLEKKYHKTKIEIQIDNHHKRIAINGIPALRVGELMGVLNVVYFSPDELKMIKESPKERRKFIDISLSQQKKVYYNALSKYNKILDQRNKLLKSNYSKKALEDMLPVWDMQLSKAGAYIIKERIKFIDKLSIYARENHFLITDKVEELKLSYDTDIEIEDENIESQLIAALLSCREKDIKLGYTTIGAHRDDMKISINEIDVRKYGSQGQQRSVALSLKLAEINHFEQESKETPILLLDDVLSELDNKRQNQLISATKNIQTIITCTEYNIISDVTPKIFQIKKGQIVT